LQIVDLLRGNWNRNSSCADQPNDASSVEELEAQPGGQLETYKRVAREERNIHWLTAIAPVMQFSEQWKEYLQAFLLQLIRYFSFKAIPRLN
jgi:hypothetical protein